MMMRRPEHTIRHEPSRPPLSARPRQERSRRAVEPKTGRLYQILKPAAQTARRQCFNPSPPTIRAARLDNLVIVPASLLPNKAEWQAMANALPAGSTLIVLPAQPGVARDALEKISSRLAGHGSRVATVQFVPHQPGNSDGPDRDHPVHNHGQPHVQVHRGRSNGHD